MGDSETAVPPLTLTSGAGGGGGSQIFSFRQAHPSGGESPSLI